MNLAIIPARGGSKRIPRKNIKNFCGRPLIAWSIESAIKCKLFDRIIVSTDDKNIASIAEKYGAEVPFVRSSELSGDYTGTIDVIAQAINWFVDHDEYPKTVCCIYATAPFVQPDDIAKGFKAISTNQWEYAFSATTYRSTIFRSFRELPEGGIEMFFPEMFSKRSQDFPEALHDAGQFYWGKPKAWINRLRIFGPKSLPIHIPHWRVQDIDTPDDWKRAELIFRMLCQKKDI